MQIISLKIFIKKQSFNPSQTQKQIKKIFISLFQTLGRHVRVVSSLREPTNTRVCVCVHALSRKQSLGSHRVYKIITASQALIHGRRGPPRVENIIQRERARPEPEIALARRRELRSLQNGRESGVAHRVVLLPKNLGMQITNPINFIPPTDVTRVNARNTGGAARRRVYSMNSSRRPAAASNATKLRNAEGGEQSGRFSLYLFSYVFL